MAQYLLSVDGGGTSSEFLLTDASGGELLRFFVGSTSKKSIGAEGAQANIAAGVRQLFAHMERLGDDEAQVRGIWGLSGCDSAADREEYEQMLVHAGLDLTYHQVINDSLLALRTCVAGSGIVLVSGTGSICVGVNEAGEMVRLGGWGYQVSDLASGTWVGSRLLREALLYDDGCREGDPAFEAVYARANCVRGELGPTIALLTGADQFAAYARIVFESPNSPLCSEIADQAAEYLAGYIHAATARFFPEEPYEVVLSGGLFKAEALVAAVSERIDATVHHLNVSPVQGGINILRAQLMQ